MIVLDTNVISAMMKAESNPQIIRWLNRIAPESLWTTTITVFEIRAGIERLPVSRRQRSLEESFTRLIEEDIQERVLVFDFPAAHETAAVAARREKQGAPMELRDMMIAGIVISRRAEFATRNVRHFHDLGLTVIDPWSA